MTFDQWFDINKEPHEGTISAAILAKFITDNEDFLREFWKEAFTQELRWRGLEIK